MKIRLQFLNLFLITLNLIVCQFHLLIFSNHSVAMTGTSENKESSQDRPRFKSMFDYFEYDYEQKLQKKVEELKKTIKAEMLKDFKKEPPISPKDKRPKFSEKLSIGQRIAVRNDVAIWYEKEISKRGKNPLYQMAHDYFITMNNLDELYSSAVNCSEENFKEIQEFVKNVDLKGLYGNDREALIKIAANFAINMIENYDPGMDHELQADTRRAARLINVKGEQMLNSLEVLSISWTARKDPKFTEQQIYDNKVDLVMELAKIMADGSLGGENCQLDYQLIEDHKEKIAVPYACGYFEFFHRLIKKFIKKTPTLDKGVEVEFFDLNHFKKPAHQEEGLEEWVNIGIYSKKGS